MTIVRRALAVAAALAALAWLERRRPLRARTQPTARRVAINLSMMVVTGACVAPIQRPVVEHALRWAEARRFGITRWLPLAPWASRAVGFALLDYTLWHWHRWNHRVPLLWAMHAAHHADLDLDLSTAARFHVGEMLASVVARAAQVALIGVDRATLRAWEFAVVVEIAFHHANLRLPAWLDAALSRIIITPRLHGIHHAARPNRLDTNYGTIFAIWDALHGTRATDLEQSELAIGLPGLLDGPTPGVIDSLRVPLEAGAWSTESSRSSTRRR